MLSSFFFLLTNFTTDYKLDVIFEWVDSELRHYFLELFLLFLDAVAEFPRESVCLLRGLAELRDYLVGLLRLRSEKLYREGVKNVKICLTLRVTLK